MIYQHCVKRLPYIHMSIIKTYLYVFEPVELFETQYILSFFFLFNTEFDHLL